MRRYSCLYPLKIPKVPIIGSSSLKAIVCQQYWGFRVKVEDTSICRSPKNPISGCRPLIGKGCQQTSWSRISKRDTPISTPWRSWKGLILRLSPLSCHQEAVQSIKGPGGRHTCLCLQSQDYRPQSWLWNLKHPWDSFSAPPSHNRGPVLTTHNPFSD